MRFARVDQNQKEIADALRSIGASVVLIHHLHGGGPDILAGYRGVTFLFEVKNPKRRTRGDNASGTLARQQRWRDVWRGGPAVVVWTADEALAVVLGKKPPDRSQGEHGPPADA